jgi:hypothetical protein
MMSEPSRRGFIASALTLFAAPAIVRASSLMPIKSSPLTFTGAVTLSDTGWRIYETQIATAAFIHEMVKGLSSSSIKAILDHFDRDHSGCGIECLAKTEFHLLSEPGGKTESELINGFLRRRSV